MNPFKTLGRWLWRWWNGREFERKPLPVGGAVALNQDQLRYSDSAQEAQAAAWRDALANAIEMRRSGNVIVDERSNPVGIFGSFSWKDKDGVVHGGPFRGQTLDDVANPLAGLTAEQIAARVNRGEPVRLKDAFEALGLKQPTSYNLVVDEAIKATILGGDVYCGEMLVTDAQVQGVTGPLDTLKYVYMLPDGTFTITRPSQDAKPIGRVSKVVKNGVANVETTP